jgi:hypothetical protein
MERASTGCDDAVDEEEDVVEREWGRPPLLEFGLFLRAHQQKNTT